MSKRNSQVVRILKILADLRWRREGMSLDTLSMRHDVSVRTVRRDLKAIKEMGFALVDQCDADGVRRYRIKTNDLIQRLLTSHDAPEDSSDEEARAERDILTEEEREELELLREIYAEQLGRIKEEKLDERRDDE